MGLTKDKENIKTVFSIILDIFCHILSCLGYPVSGKVHIANGVIANLMSNVWFYFQL